MRKVLAIIVFAGVVCLAGPADAIKLTHNKSIGWFDMRAPIGGGYFFNENVGVQAGFGFNKFDDGFDETDEETALAFAVAVPIRLAGPETCHFYLRPGLLYETNPSLANESAFALRADLAVEYFFSHHFSIVGGHGVEYRTVTPSDDDAESTSSFGSRAITLSSVGFFYYFGGDH